MLLFAAAAAANNNPTTLEKLKAVPPMFWVKIGLGLIAILVAVWLVKLIATRVPKMLLIAGALVTIGVLFFSWIYQRNEPAFMTPIIQPIADSGFFPTKDGYELRELDESGQKGRRPTSTKPAPAPKK